MSYNRFASAVTGFDTWKTNTRIRAFDAFGNKSFTDDYSGYRQAGTALRSNYSFGDEAARDQMEQLLGGDASLVIGGADGHARTEMVGGERVINMATLGDRGNNYSRLRAGVTLQHEAHRDGIVSSQAAQEAETIRAVRSHTEMAIAMGSEYGMGLFEEDANLLADLSAYAVSGGGGEGFGEYVLGNYDSSDDYWKLTNRDGEWGWEDDGNLDFDISEALKEHPELLIENPEILAAMLSGEDGRIAHEQMSEEIIGDIGWALHGEAYSAHANLAGRRGTPTWVNDRYREAAGRLTGFMDGTQAFVGASGAAEALMASPSQAGLDSLGNAMMGVQSSGLLFEHAVSNNSEGLLGDGTTDRPYLPTRAREDGTVKVTSWPGFRFVNDGFYNDLKENMVDAGERSQEWLDNYYPKREFAFYEHAGGDLVGSGDIVAQVAGSIQMSYDRTFGLGATSVSQHDQSRGYFTGHLDPSSVMDYISAFATHGTSLRAGNDGYTLEGVAAGMVVGQQGNTGVGSGVHAHNEIRFLNSSTGTYERNLQSIRAWNRVFRSYAGADPTEWAASFSGYTRPDYNDPRLWNQTRHSWLTSGSSYMNYPLFQWEQGAIWN